MTTDIERQFFETFGIEPRPIYSELWADEWVKDEYPQITDRILLELLCIFNKAQHEIYSDINILEFDVDSLKNSVLKWSIWLNKAYKKGYFKQQVQALFKEG